MNVVVQSREFFCYNINMNKEKIIKIAKNIGINEVGFKSAANFEYLKKDLIERKEKGLLTNFEEENIDKRIYPEIELEDAKTFIVILEKYKNDNNKYISKCSVGEDYHRVLNRKLDILKEHIPGNCVSYVDTSPFLEREIARGAGLGFIGKNRNFISYKNGSFVFIGFILTDYDFNANDDYQEQKCGNCTKCISKCPTGALDDGYDPKKCLAYITQLKIIPDQYKGKIKSLYGCDICQDVCPYNKEVENLNIQNKFNEDLSFILNMNKKDFYKTYKNTSSGWRGKSILIRNAILLVINLKLKEYYKDVKKALESDSYIIKDVEKWVISKVGDLEEVH